MRALFVHTADNHLGYEQYGVKERFNDFTRAFWAIIDDAIARKADAFVIAGDLFNKRAIDARTLMHAQEGLARLRDAGIPAVAIEGNHDRSYYRDGVSWLEFLCWQNLLILLNPYFESGVPKLTPWNQDEMRGAYLDLKGGKLRIYGLPWYGASTPRVLKSLAEQLESIREAEDAAGVEYRLLMLHTGVEGIVPALHGLPQRSDFEPLRGLVDYVALGHVHKHYCIDDWLHNPGSTETWGAEESGWERGYYVVRIDTDVPEDTPRFTAEHVINPRRPFLRLPFNVEGLHDPAALYEAFERHCRVKAREFAVPAQAEPGLEPVVDVLLTGVLSFDASALDRSRLEDIVEQMFHPLVVRVHDSTRDSAWDVEDDGTLDGNDRSTWQQLEMHIFEELLARDARYQQHAGEWAKLVATLKQMALGGESPEQIVGKLRDERARLLP
ncbi:MAG: metallophosphoesterase family protein [Nitrososphaerota archaeon]